MDVSGHIFYKTRMPRPKIEPYRDRGSQTEHPRRVDDNHLHVWIPSHLRAALDKCSELDAMTRGEIVTIALERYFKARRSAIGALGDDLKVPVRCPGGKSMALEQLAPSFPSAVDEYREPCVGGGS